MRIAIHNIHKLPLNLNFHEYIYDLLRSKKITILYFSDCNIVSYAKFIFNFINNENKKHKFHNVNWQEFDFIFTTKELNAKADVLLNINLMCFQDVNSEFMKSISRFNGLKIFHIGDYFWYRPASETNKLLESIGVDHLFGYSMHDNYCNYFKKSFPSFEEKVWGIPFGFSDRFVNSIDFTKRKSKAVALGSVNPLRQLKEPATNFIEIADFFPDEIWFHKFRRMLVLQKTDLADVMDSMLPEYPMIKDFKYDLVAKFNEYKMFVTCESILNFPSAKVYEGLACGTVLICADLECNKEYGLVSEENCIMYKNLDINDFKDKVVYFQKNQTELSRISMNGYEYSLANFSSKSIANYIINTLELIYNKNGNVFSTSFANRKNKLLQ
jgi:glycosyltransferase involved in cell wall biosynthesis